MKENARFYVYDSKQEAVLEEAGGVFRTNCLDCLDRTNYFQAKLALLTVECVGREFGLGSWDLLRDMRNGQGGKFVEQFRHAWADNGDAISYHYTGTGSTHTEYLWLTQHHSRRTARVVRGSKAQV